MNARQLLDHLRQVRQLRFSAQSQGATGWNGQGSGAVEAESPAQDVVVFRESGRWRPQGQHDTDGVAFRNVYRWSRADDTTVRLEHLRLGPEQPVFLLDLVPESEHVWRTAEPHLCVADIYALRLTLAPDGLQAAWTIRGPKKQELLDYVYAF